MMSDLKEAKFKIGIFLLLVGSLIGGGAWLYDYSGGFTLANISYNMPHREDWSLPPLSAEDKNDLRSALAQPFSYLGTGNQVYAFVSQDQQYVLKFFKFGHLKPKKRDLEIARERKAKKIERIFNAYRLSYLLDKQNTGVVYVHLNKSNDLNQEVTIKDKFGFVHSLDLDQTVFVLQKKGTPLKVVLQNLLDKGDVEASKSKIRDLFDMYVEEYQLGIFDNDHNVIYNTGFADNKSFRLDPGKIIFDPSYKNPGIYEQDLGKIVHKRLAKWLGSYYPKYRDEIVQDMEAKLQEIRHKRMQNSES